MANLLERGTRWLASKLKDHASTTVVYRRGADSAEVLATLGFQLLRISDRPGNTKVERTDRDFLINAEDLILAGFLVSPQRGDFIDIPGEPVLDELGNVIASEPTDEILGNTNRYEVMGYGSEAPWRYSDPNQIRFRIHTKYRSSI